MAPLFVVAAGCGGLGGGCGGCGSEPLPAGGLPSNQTIEGGAQIRVTESGFQTITSIVPGLLNDALSGGMCVPRGQVGRPSGGFLATGAEWCYQNNGSCTAGCQVNVGINAPQTSVSVIGPGKLRVQMRASANTSIPVRGQVLSIGASCTLSASTNSLGGSFDIAFGIKPSNGELDIHLDRVNNFTLGLDVNGCGLLGDIADLGSEIIDSFLGQFLIQLLTPAIDDLLQDFIPSPLGIEGLLDVGGLLAGFSPGTDALMESRFVPGGYVQIDTATRGMSLGVITGMNADVNILTRSGLRPDNIPFISEPHLCVPPMSPPAFGAAPHNLTAPTDNPARGTFFLAPGGELAAGGSTDSADVVMGMSETFLDLAGHHLVSSGAMCLGIGGNQLSALNVGTIALLVPSLGDLTSGLGRDPLMLVTRPQKPVNVTIGDNTEMSPAITLGIEKLEVDFYAFLYERYVRAFTMVLTMDVGINLEFEPGTPAKIRPTLVGISSQSVDVQVINAEFVREPASQLENVLPSVFDLVTPLLGNIGAIDVPEFAGLSLNNLGIKHVVTPQDDFIAITAKLGPSAMLRTLAESSPMVHDIVEEMEAKLGPPAGPRVAINANLRAVTRPSPDNVRRAMTSGGAGMPEVTFDVPMTDELGRELEYTYNLNGGLYRPYRAAVNGAFVVRDPAFAWQSKYRIGMKSRVKGDYRTTSDEAVRDVIIDSVGPHIAADELFWDNDALRVPMFDLVSANAVTYAFGPVGADEPSTEWTRGSNAEILREQAQALAVNGELLVFSKDEAGNRSVALIAPFHGNPDEDAAGCASCNTTGGPSAGGIMLVMMVGGVLVLGGRRRRTQLASLAQARWVKHLATFGAIVIGSALMPACDCNNEPAGAACEVNADCSEGCLQGEIGSCIDGMCICSSDIIAGRVGAYSDVAVAPDGSMWVSGYAVNNGDLVVAKATGGRIPMETWEWVDGVPDGPVVVQDSEIRGGIQAPGPDVGMYTSIAVDAQNQPMVTYFDRDAGSLKFAHKVGDTWQKHDIQTGTGRYLGEFDGQLIGMYTSLSLRNDGFPGVAYLAHVKDTNGIRAEVRFAQAKTAAPAGPADWNLYIVEAAPLTVPDDAYPLPQGLGLFIDSARMPDGAPVVVYYDRTNGDLKSSKFNTGAGAFAAATILDGSTTDAGWSPSVVVDDTGKVHVAYVGATGDDLKYLVEGGEPETVDDGYRLVGTTDDGLPKPEFHFVGDDASLQLINGMPVISYQDATTQELLFASRVAENDWNRESIAGATDPWPGAYGFFAASARVGTDVVMSTWVINQPAGNPWDDNWVEVFRRQVVVQ